MIPVSDAWKATMDSNTAYTTSATISLASGTVLTVTPADVCMSGNGFTDGPGLSAFPVGAAMSRTMQLNLDNHDERYADVDFLGAVIRLYLNYGTENITLGKFTVRTPETYGETVMLTAQDDMYKADKPFASALTYPATAGALWSEICTACGLTDGMPGGIPQASYSLAAAPSSDLTYRAVLGYIAMLSGGNARVNRLGQLEIVNYDFDTLEAQRTAGTAESIHDLALWRSLRLDTEDVTITGVQTTDYNGEESTAVLVGSEGYVLALENPLFAGQERTALTALAAVLVGKTFRGFSGEYIAYPLAEFGDGARITDRKGNTYYTVITDVDFAWAAPTQLGNSAESPLQNASKYAAPSVTTLQRAAQMVAAEKTARETAVAALANALAASGGMYLTTEAAAGGGTIYYLHDKAALAASSIVLKLTVEALGISTDGGQTYPTGWDFATGTTITNILQANGINADWIDTGKLTVTDEDGNVVFEADVDSKAVKMASWTADMEYLTSTGVYGTYEYYLKLGAGVIKTQGGTINAVRMTRQMMDMGHATNYAGDGIGVVLPIGEGYEGSGYFTTGLHVALDNGRSIWQVDAYGSSGSSYTVDVTHFGNVIVGDSATSYSLRVNGRNLLSEIGTLSSLATAAQDSLVAAINEVDAKADALGTKTYLASETTNANSSVISITSNQSYLENNTIHLAAVLTMTGNRAANTATIGFLTHPPAARTSYCLFVNTSTGAVTTGFFAPSNNGYIYTGAALSSGVTYYLYGTLPLD